MRDKRPLGSIGESEDCLALHAEVPATSDIYRFAVPAIRRLGVSAVRKLSVLLAG